ncbi:MAG TPA: S-layer homology domain-containing protein [Clostridia bacterium]|nr:S-layer homology domain-containing protein [Clostridia bacterium]
MMLFTGRSRIKRQRDGVIDGQTAEYNINHTLKKTFLFLLFVFAVFILSAQSAFGTSFVPSPGSPDSDTKIRLDWSSVPGAQTYVISRDSGSGFAEVETIDVGHVQDPLTYTDTGLQPEKTYRYRLVALSDAGSPLLLDRAYEKICVATTTKMIRPYGLRAVFDINSRTAILSWNCSGLATGSVINRTENGITTPISTADTTSAAITIDGSSSVRFTVSSTAVGIPASNASDPITIIPVQQPILQAVSSNGRATISWDSFPQISLFQLERARWNDTSKYWENWTLINSALTGTSTTDTPAEGGQYRYRLSAKQGSGYTGYSSITDLTNGLPAPANLKLAVLDTGSVSLTWTNGPGNTANIQILRKLADGSFTQIKMLSGSETSCIDQVPVTNGTTYTYRVRAFIPPSNYSPAAEASITAALPDTPGQLYAYVTSTTAITLNWTDRSTNEQEYRIERLTNAGVFTQIAVLPAVTGSAIGITYTDSTVLAGDTYIYRVRAWNAMGYSPYSNEVTVNAWDSVAPATLVVTPVSSSRIDLAWSYTGTESYNTIIERKTGTDGTWAPIYTTALGTVKYSDTGLAANTRYFYRVKKALGTGSAGIAFPAGNIGIGAYTYLGTLSLTGAADTGNRIYLSWSGNSAGADVVIERKMPNGSFSALTTVGPSAYYWYDNTGLVPSASYTYRIKAKTTTNESQYSSEITVRNLYLEPPTGLSVSVVTSSAITLKWTDNSSDENGFEIWRYTEGSGTFTLYATVGKNITTFTDKLINYGVRYQYKVRAYVASGSMYSPFSGTASVGIGLINPPANLYYEYVSSNQIMLRWTDTSDNETGFKVEWKKEMEGEWSIYKWMDAGYTACQVTELNPYTKYYFRVRVYSNTGSVDALSNEILVTTAVPAAPSDVKAVSLSANQAKITWKDNSDGEDGFRVLKKPSNGYYFEVVAELKKNITSYTDNLVVPGSLFYYKVVSYNATGSSESLETSVRINTKAYFSDLGSVPWARDAIENLAGLGVIQGVRGTIFKPNGTITKAEFTAIVVRAFNFDTSTVGSLADVRSNKWYYRDIMVAENLGIISGDSQNRFYPETPITREEIAKILFKALEVSGKEFTLHDNSVLEKFNDKNRISPDALASVATLVGEGIIEGVSDNAIGPRNTATRAQAAVIMYRTLNRINK